MGIFVEKSVTNQIYSLEKIYERNTELQKDENKLYPYWYFEGILS